ncbi:MAG: aminopeptidase P family protein [Burkholderiales bacterium]|nr:aminopeptidase P family protein [Burkholderiales bacterium]
MTAAVARVDIPSAEFAARRAKAIAGARAQGLAGLVVCGRGGGALDRYADLMYLTNHYSPFPFIPDLAGEWTGRAHSFLLLPCAGDPVLIVDVPYVEPIALPAVQIVMTDLVVEGVCAALRTTGLAKGRIGLVGEDIVPVSMYRALQSAAPAAEWIGADHILAAARAIKSPAEITRLRAAARVGSRMIEAMMAAAVPGATHGDVVAAGLQVLVPAGGMLYNSFMASGTGGAQPTFVRASFPTWSSSTPLANGQWLRVGISGVLDDYYFDVSRSRAIGPATKEQIGTFEAAIAVVEAGIAALRPGVTAGDVATAGLRKQQSLGFPLNGVFSGLGHGIGLGWDSPWLVPEETMPLVPGMVLNFERTLTRDGYLGDFEETVLLTEHGVERLTDAQVRLW